MCTSVQTRRMRFLRNALPIWSTGAAFALAFIMWLLTGSVFAFVLAAFGPVMAFAQRKDAATRTDSGHTRAIEPVAQPRPDTAFATASRMPLALDPVTELGTRDGEAFTIPHSASVVLWGNEVLVQSHLRHIRASRERVSVPSTRASPGAVSVGSGEWRDRKAGADAARGDEWNCVVQSPVEALAYPPDGYATSPLNYKPAFADGVNTSASGVRVKNQPQEQRLDVLIAHRTDNTPVYLGIVTATHLVIAGASGSGKSELIRRIVTELQQRYTPAQVELLFLDFKGGATFRDISDTAHVRGLFTDIECDESTLDRIVLALQDEMRRREQVLADSHYRDISETNEPRLVVCVDEAAALFARHRGVARQCDDIAARGRALGVHLILGSQRPGNGIPDDVLANAGCRIALRLQSASDSRTLLGNEAALQLRTAGQAIVWDGAVPEVVQVKPAEIHSLNDADRVKHGRCIHRSFIQTPPPIPLHQSEIATLGGADGTWLVSEDLANRTYRFISAPNRSTVILGAPGSGRTSALRSCFASLVETGQPAIWLSATAPALWRAVKEFGNAMTPPTLLVDNLDDVLRTEPPATRVELIERLQQYMALPAGGVVFASRTPHTLESHCHDRLELGPSPGHGNWRGAPVTIRYSAGSPEPWTHTRDVLEPGPIVVVTRVASNFPAMGLHVVSPEQWTIERHSTSRFEPEVPVVFWGMSSNDVRVVVQRRELSMPLLPNEHWALMPDARIRAVTIPWLESHVQLADAA